MKLFLQRVMLFCAGPVAVFLILAALARPPVNPLVDTIHTVVIGDSHAQCAVDDSHLPGVANLAASSESYLFSYAKLRHLFRQPPPIHTVLLDISYHSFSSCYEDFIWGTYSKTILVQYARLFRMSERAMIVRHDRNSSISLLRGMLPLSASSFFHPQTFRLPGGYVAKDTDVPLNDYSIRHRIQFHYFQNGQVLPLSAFNQYWLERIVQLCRQNGVRLVLLSTPLHPAYRDLVPPLHRAACDNWIKDSGLEIVDLRNLSLPDDCFLPDGDHVNPRGAQIVTDHLADFFRPPPPAP